jgi:DNA-directed RNA polymerase specialized sigma24 family protein
MALPDYSSILAKLFPAVFHLANRRVSDPRKAWRVAHDVFLLGYRDYGRYRDRSLDEYRKYLFRICRKRCWLDAGAQQTSRLPDEAYLFISLRSDGYDYEEIAAMLGKTVGWAFATARALRAGHLQNRDWASTCASRGLA